MGDSAAEFSLSWCQDRVRTGLSWGLRASFPHLMRKHKGLRTGKDSDIADTAGGRAVAGRGQDRKCSGLRVLGQH